MTVPIKVVIGVTGHRKLADPDMVREKLNEMFELVDKKFSRSLKNSDYSFSIISPLAEGADRIAVEELLKYKDLSSYKNPSLEVILPLPLEEFADDFETEESKEEFKAYLDMAESVKVLDKTESREEAYYESGIYVVDRCDILIAVWNGRSANGLGGTAEIVEYARERKKWIYWINSETGAIKLETGAKENDSTIKLFKYLDIYNGENLNENQIKNETDRNYKSFKDTAEYVGLPLQFISLLKENLIPQFVRADLLAQRYQKLYNLVGNAIYILSAGAVATVTLQIFFFPDIPQLIWFEVAEISIILVLVLVSNRRDWHRKWIDYRFLAERLRTGLFFNLANLKCEISLPPPHLRLTSYTKDWILEAFNSIWCENPGMDKEIHFESFKNFLLKGWIEDQISYYQKSSMKNHKNHVIYTRVGAIFFIITLFAATIHTLNIEVFENPLILPAVAIILPAAAAALTGIRNNHEYSRNAKRYKEMALYTMTIKERIKQVEDIDSLVEILEKTNEIMLQEHQDWRVVVQFHKLEPP